ncbi:hypothetical protein H9P43_001485 [Blastocladiella emersonii ATCC 22665]|nr:hypothetical protein H9P43_001485 [Blastocladiella emersonii ATCC 22665]
MPPPAPAAQGLTPLVLPPVKAPGTVFQPVELVVPTTPKDKDRKAAVTVATPVFVTSGFVNLSDDVEGAPTAFQASLGDPPPDLSGSVPTVPYRNLPRDNVVALLHKVNTRDSAKAAQAASSSKPAARPAAAGGAPADYSYTRKYKRNIVAKPTPGVVAASQRRKKNRREVTLQSNLDDIRTFRNTMVAPAPGLGLIKDEFLEFESPNPPAGKKKRQSVVNQGAASPAAAAAAAAGANALLAAIGELPGEGAAAATLTAVGADGAIAAARLAASGEPAPGAVPAETIVNPFMVMCDDVVNSLAEFESAMQTFSLWKNDFLKQNVTSGVKLTLALMVSKIVRTQSDLSQMVLELIRGVRVYSSQWADKLNAITELEEEHARQSRAFDIALRKLESMHGQVTRNRTNRQIFMWEYITKKLVRRHQELAAMEDDSDDDSDWDKESVSGDEDGEADDADAVASGASLSGSRGPSAPGTAPGTAAPAVGSLLKQEYAKVVGGLAASGPAPKPAAATGSKKSKAGDDDKGKSKSSSKDKTGTGGGKKPRDDAQRVHEIRSILESKRKEREAQLRAAQEAELPRRAMLEQKFNELLNRMYPSLPRSIFAFHQRERHAPMYYASEVLVLEIPKGEPPKDLSKRSAWLAEDAVELARPPQPRGLVRSNSANALYQMANHRRDFVPLKERELMQKASDALMKAHRARFPAHALRFDKVLGSPAGSKPGTAPTDYDGDAALLTIPHVDLNKTWFTLQDVVELSLLHMQQIQQLRNEYENRVLQLTQLNTQHNVIPKNWQHVTDAAPTPRQGGSRAELRSRNQSGASLAKQSGQQLHQPPRKSKSPGPAAKPSPPSPRRKSPIRFKPKPILNSSLLDMTFMDRMTRMAAAAHKRKADVSERIMRKEFEENLTKVVRDRTQTFSKEQVVELMERVMDRFKPRSPHSGSGDGKVTEDEFDLFEIARPLSRRGQEGPPPPPPPQT